MAFPVRTVKIEVAHALATAQSLLVLQVAAGTTVRQAIEQSGLLQLYPDIDLTRHAVGIFGRICGLEEALQDGDRVEIYRPLRVEPKLRRRQRAAQQRSQT